LNRLRPKTAVVLALLLASSAIRLAAETPAQPSMGSPLESGLVSLARHDYREAVSQLEHADQLAGGRSAECLIALARAYTGSGSYRKAETAARSAIALAPPPDLLRQAYNQLATALVDSRPNDAGLAEAENLLRRAIDLSEDKGAPARYNLAEVLRQRKKIPEAVAVAREILADDPVGPTAREARILVCHLRSGPPAGAVVETLRPERFGDEAGAEPGTGIVHRPVALLVVNPEYTERARRAKVKGKVVVETIVDEEGCVVQAKILKRLALGLDQAALDAARRWVFRPAIFEGKPVKVYYTLTVNFAVY
jgi:TonB family protein